MEAIKKGHVLAVPVPGQGHVKPMMRLCRRIAKHGIKVTFVNIKSVHDKLVAAGEEDMEEQHNLILTWIPDPVAENDSNVLETLRKKLPGSLMELIERINGSDPDDKISCVVGDLTIGWVLETAEKMGAIPVAFSPTSNASMALSIHIPKLLEDGVLDPDYGTIQKGEKIRLSDDIPSWGKDELVWGFPSNLEVQKSFFESAQFISEKSNQTKWMVISNTCYEIESSACDMSPDLRPVGPLLDINNSCNFYPEDVTCLSWLDTKPPESVIYVSFGSLAFFSQHQLDELAQGLELSGRAFLWVVRSDLANGSRAVCPDGFLERVGEMGKIVEWAPQEKVLTHPSVACFLSHCGWNSTLEGLSKGVPFLCWPYFSDQFHNQNYICDKWEIGLRINPDENGIRLRHEIKKKIDMLFCDDSLKVNALALKETCEKSVNEGGSSYKNFEAFIDYIR
ncbi:hypothetical protein ACS0TY_004176 [Phlomoides rotata]